ncbi:MAG: helix-turn-helix transcriptional regulator [Cyclobacteriaceae bacterium]
MKIRKTINIEHSAEAVLVAQIADALAHPVRVSLLVYVRSKNVVRNDVCNKDLVAHFDYSQSSLSQHVKKLRECGLFEVTYQDKFSFYRVNEDLLKLFTTKVNDLG